jgi:predicted ribosome quality control (RQC) complex YloA/Tae2 family protein
MLSNYFTLLHIAKLLNRRYARTVVAEVYSQEKNTLSILLYAPEPHTITVSCTARENYIAIKKADVRTRTNTIDLFPLLIDKHIEAVYMSATDRIVTIRFSENLWMCLEMFASKANVVLCDANGAIVDAFLNKKELLSEKRELQLAEQEISVNDILPSKEHFLTVLSGDEEKLKLLKKGIPKLGATLAEEVLFRCSSGSESHAMDSRIPAVDPSTANDINSTIFDTVKKIAQTILSLDEVFPTIYYEEQSPVCFSLLPLEHLSSYRQEQFDDLFAGIQKFIGAERSTSSFLKKKKEISSWLTKELEKGERTICSVEAELAESSRADQYELYANLIMTHLHSIEKGTKSAGVENPFSKNEFVTIPLDASLTPQKNAEKYFEKAKRSKTGIEESRRRLLTLKQRLAAINAVLEKSNHIKDGFSLKFFIQSYGGMVKELGYMTEKEQEELPPFKIFAVEGGFTVYAGKNSANNDLLTFRFAKPNDLWFHARGSSGSHVVLKIGSAQGTPTKKAIEQAASIAAYYSKMKNAKHVPVAMTERKYIHKPKGAPPGTVALDKEKVIFVQPVLPGKEL